MKTTEAVIGRWPEVFAAFGLPPVDPRKHYKGECPMCGRKGKLRVDDKDGMGTWICVCGAGTGFEMLTQVTGKPFSMLAQEVDQIIGNTFEPERRQEPRVNTKLERSVSRFREIHALEGTPGEEYLNRRGIFQLPKGGVKWSPGEVHRETNKTWPCLYALASNEYGEAIQRHLTFLDGDQKADIDPQKKMLALQEYSGTIAVKLFPPQSTLGIAEGIETALSAHQLYKCPVWSTLNAVLMERFKAPPGVTTLMIFADDDSSLTGLAAAMTCGKKNLSANNDVNQVIVRWPEGGDFNDVVMKGSKVFQWRGSK
jgi:putative DNA primase/helicase